MDGGERVTRERPPSKVQGRLSSQKTSIPEEQQELRKAASEKQGRKMERSARGREAVVTFLLQ